MLQKLNTVFAGILIGIVIPAIIFSLFVYPRIDHLSFFGSKIFHQILAEILPLLLSRCIFPNALLFFILIWRNQNLVAKGILISTGVLTSVLLFISFVV